MYSEPVSTLVPAAQPASDPAIRIEGLSKYFSVYHSPLERLRHIISPARTKGFDNFRALNNINLSVERGETCAIVGQNGSGKSTLLQILCGTLRATEGTIEVNGRIAALLELGAGFNTDFTGRENVYMNGAVLGLTRAQIDERFADIEAFAEIGDFMDQPVKTYSSGMYVRLAFSVAIHVDPQILIVDEALAVGDSRFQAKCLNRIKAMKATGVTILFVSHDVGAVRSLCDNALWLDKGNVRMLGDAFSVTAQYNQFLFEADEGAAAAPAPLSPPVDGESAAPQVPADIEDAQQAMRLHRPINHWGSHVGSILDAGIFNSHGERASVYTDGEPLTVRIRFQPPVNANRSTMSAAFSMKDLRGTDLIVSTTWDQNPSGFDAHADTLVAEFRLPNHLNAGDYLLAVALEDRSGVQPQYYEYIEGAHYFSSLTRTRQYGTFLAEVAQTIRAD
ncbi:ABC transporter ATP-binding protein [Diaphorobacter aerolatus]|uniref:ABC transporter ATP-binding protein n=1 Tax=Diaphorobacter aerolatus TaxID=1288495 RepID=A0A7H0GK90_9BURK|nr:ABC transporter ATP-binding protein [Diaphorobacter aerolatus]QNP48706.1 ABC transporter ATP-binding protein [Diaphorobacter aerolatus]